MQPLPCLCICLEKYNDMKTLTVFTPTYNRKHTIHRTYESLCRQTSSDFDWLIIDDGSSDGTRAWVESLGEKRLKTERFDIEYIYKPNGGLYTGYNTAYATIKTELCVCIDSDDFMPDDAVEKIVQRWNERFRDKEYCGIVGLDFNVVDGKPIGGFFSDHLSEAYQTEIVHTGDVKQVMRTDLMRQVAPQIGFKGEKDFNPFYMLIQVLDKYPILISNDNFCWVEYQIGTDSMSQGIWKQYVRSPRSYAKYRINQMTLKHGNSLKNKFRLCVHYVSSCLLGKDGEWLKKSPLKGLTIMAAPLGLLLYFYVKHKNRK